MAVSPKIVIENRQPAFDAAEKIIDALILKAGISQSNGNCNVYVPPKFGINSAEFKAHLVPKYIRAGWKAATWIFDRDGQFIQFIP